MAKRRKRRAPGRPTHLTPAVARKILSGIRTGLPLKMAAGVARVPYATVREWISRGEKDTSLEPFASFAVEVEFARADAFKRLYGRIISRKEDARRQRNLAWVAERLYPGALDPDHHKRHLENQALRAQLNKNDAAGEITVVVECEPAPSETTVAPHVAPGGDPQRP